MSARQELLTTGRLGRAGAELLYTTVRAVAIARGFPPPVGQPIWDEVAVQATAHDFLQGARGAKRLLDVAVRSTDERSFARLLGRAVQNHLRDVARATDLGKLIVRVKEVLRSTDDFVAVAAPGGERWAARGGSREPSIVPPDELSAATKSIEVVVPRWTSETRDAPLADRDSMVRLLTAILSAASGTVTAVEIAHAITARLEHRRAPLTVELDAGGVRSEQLVVGTDPETTTLAAMRATQIFNDLSDRERIMVATLDLSVRDLGLLVSTGKSQAALLRQRLIDRVAEELRDDDDPERTVSALALLCDDWIGDRTGPGDATS